MTKQETRWKIYEKVHINLINLVWILKNKIKKWKLE